MQANSVYDPNRAAKLICLCISMSAAGLLWGVIHRVVRQAAHVWTFPPTFASGLDVGVACIGVVCAVVGALQWRRLREAARQVDLKIPPYLITFAVLFFAAWWLPATATGTTALFDLLWLTGTCVLLAVIIRAAWWWMMRQDLERDLRSLSEDDPKQFVVRL